MHPLARVMHLSINYLFFALLARGSFDGALRAVWSRFWDTYLRKTKDDGVLEVMAPFYAWRALVLACPTWYPSIRAGVRDRVLAFAEELLAGAPFDPQVLAGLPA